MNVELEAFKRMERASCYDSNLHTLYSIECKIVEIGLVVLHILKEKRVNIGIIIYCDNYKTYNDMVDGKDKELNEEEFNLIYEWLR